MPPPLVSRQEVSIRSTERAEPLIGTVFGVVVSLSAISILSSFLTERYLNIRSWKKLPIVIWVVLAIFIDSWAFVFTTAILQQGLGVNKSFKICQGAILLCLVFYVTTKILIYFFLVEKAFLIGKGITAKSRLKSKLYIFNAFGMLTVYCSVSALNFVFRITRIEDGLCIIGMKKLAMIPLIGFDLLVNIYLTILFLVPLRSLYSFKTLHRTAANERLRIVAIRTFIGACCTTISSVVNLSVLMMLNGEPGWVCLMCCNIDILFSAVIIHWVTSRDHRGSNFIETWAYGAHRVSRTESHRIAGSHRLQYMQQRRASMLESPMHDVDVLPTSKIPSSYLYPADKADSLSEDGSCGKRRNGMLFSNGKRASGKNFEHIEQENQLVLGAMDFRLDDVDRDASTAEGSEKSDQGHNWTTFKGDRCLRIRVGEPRRLDESSSRRDDYFLSEAAPPQNGRSVSEGESSSSQGSTNQMGRKPQSSASYPDDG